MFFDSDHMFFSDYSKRLSDSLDEINWTSVLRLSKELLATKSLRLLGVFVR